MSIDGVKQDVENATNLEWPDPQPLPAGLPSVPVLDECLLPEGLRAWLVDIAERAQAPLDFPAAGAIVALSSAMGRRIGIRPKRYDDWLVVSNLWGTIVGPPGFLKSPMLHEVVKPLIQLEAQAGKDYQQQRGDYELEEQALQAERRKVLSKASRPNCELHRHEVISQLRELIVEAPTRRRYVVNDPTVEKLGQILQ